MHVDSQDVLRDFCICMVELQYHRWIVFRKYFPPYFCRNELCIGAKLQNPNPKPIFFSFLIRFNAQAKVPESGALCVALHNNVCGELLRQKSVFVCASSLHFVRQVCWTVQERLPSLCVSTLKGLHAVYTYTRTHTDRPTDRTTELTARHKKNIMQHT